jgi:predicted nucleic acid-binding protein
LITAVDSSVLIDVLEPDSAHAASSKRAFARCRREGSLITGEVVWAEVAGRFGSAEHVRQAMHRLGVSLTPSDDRVAFRAGSMWWDYLRAGGDRTRVLPDFFIGAHAMEFAERLLTRDEGYYRRYFSQLPVVVPGSRA